MDLYREEVMEHYENPRNQGELEGEGVKSARDSNASCGDMVEIYLKIEKGKIVDVKWKGIGCAITTAASSKLSEYLQGLLVMEVKKMDEEELMKKGIGFEVNPGRSKCLRLPARVVMKIVKG
ncbi:MAG: iron-sulfur cluster assembly scaffold protein [bacterium]